MLAESTIQQVNLKMVDRFRQWLLAQHYARSTQERYCSISRELCHHVGGRSLGSVTPMDIGEFLTATLPHRWADNFITDRLSALRCFFDFLYLGGVVDRVAPGFLKSRPRQRTLGSSA